MAAAPLVLEDVHQRLGAALIEMDGWRVPRDYGDPAGEHGAFYAPEGAALVDRSMLGKVVVTGRDRQAFLQGMLTNDVKSLLPGQGVAAAFLDAHGKVMALLRVYALEDRLWLELPAGLTDATLQALDHFLISEKVVFEPADAAFAIVGVQGPAARTLLEKLTGLGLELPPHHHVEARVGGVTVRVVHRKEGVNPGFHCWTAPAEAAVLWQALADAGARPVGMAALDTYRVEGGVPWYGRDVDQAQILPETGLEDLVSYTKGCYIGQEVVARVKYRGHVNRALTGLVLDGEAVPDRGARVFAEDKDVGWITSATRSPALGRVVALGYVRREHLAAGSSVIVAVDGPPVAAKVAPLPLLQV
jgi:folate-binding protein YgfZ